ncbi:T9SS type A sorting domain-containing protein [Kordia sp.]|uniref:T9SS type A sorting domain-containing protein n=1 Tax=Kordia sp. TaxID=1965332 RepID=UPI003D27A4B0
MKKIFSLLSILLISHSIHAQVDFEIHMLSDNGTTGSLPVALVHADLDVDGDIDIVGFSQNDNAVVWYENDGTENFGLPTTLFNFTETNIPILRIADIDGDNDMDIAFGHRLTIYWYENLDGNLNFASAQPIAYGDLYDFSLHDVDNDNDLDVVFSEISMGFYSGLSVVKNTDGLGTFGTSTLRSYATQFFSIADIDGDGNLDIAYSKSFSTAFQPDEREIAFLRNEDGLGQYNNSRVVLFDNATTTNIVIADMDADNDKDVLAGLVWFENLDGVANFDTNWNWIFANVNTDNNSNYRVVAIEDLDADGDNDIIFRSRTTDNYTTVSWLENDGSGNFTALHIIATGISDSSLFISDSSLFIDVIDLNNDGALDVILAVESTNQILWYKNVGRLPNEINGNVSLDIDANGCGINDIDISNVIVVADNGINTYATYPLADGSYTIPVSEGVFTTTIQSTISSNYSVVPNIHTNTLTGFGATATADFCLTPNSLLTDLSVAVYPNIDDPRPGFDTTYEIVYKNEGTTQQSGSVSFQYDDSKIQFLNASQTIDVQTSNTITFNYVDLNPFEIRTINLEFNVLAPPVNNIGETLSATTIVNPVTGDVTATNNVFTINQTLIGSYDPNDINVLEGTEILLEDSDKFLHYTIRFQNTGTASAINVSVNNELDANLDWSTFQLESLSHTGHVKITDGNELKFIFDNINLPDSTSDEPNSHGFITYRIKPKTNIAIGDVISNKAAIFFDFNLPIITNTVTTEVIQLLSVEAFANEIFSLYPNPTENVVSVRGSEFVTKVFVYNSHGKRMKEIDFNGVRKDFQVEMNTYKAGIYFISIETVKGKYTYKLIKK